MYITLISEHIKGTNIQPQTSKVDPNGAFRLNPKEPHKGHFVDVHLCEALEELFKGKDVLDLGAGIGLYGRCLLHIMAPMLKESPAADQMFFE